MQLEQFEMATGESKLISTDPTEQIILDTINNLSWNDLTFVILKIDDDNLMEGSGSLNPSDGLSARYLENGQEHVSSSAPESLQIIYDLLASYLVGDNTWRHIIDWG